MADTTVAKADLGKVLSPDAPVEGFTHHAEDITADREPYGPPGLRGLVSNPFVLMCAACSTLGGLIFGYDQGVVSVILVMDQFLEEFPRVGGAGAGFWKGLLTAMIELGALLGALNQGWIADKISRRYSILVAVAIFTIGSILQTAAVGYPMLVVARLIGGFGIGMLSMVAPLYISEISKSTFLPLWVLSLSNFLRLHSSPAPNHTQLKLICLYFPSTSRPPRMSWNATCPRGVLYRAWYRDCLLDHVRYTVHGR